MTWLDELCARIEEPSAAVAQQTQRILDQKTKPRRSLGRLEELACRIAAIRGTAAPPLPDKAIVVMAADHGVAEEGVSAYPQQVTAQMLLNFAGGGAAINVLARQAGARVVVVDMGVKQPVSAPGILDRRIGPGTQNFARVPAMTAAQALAAIEAGARIADELVRSGVSLIGIGEMGIANTTAASALTAALTAAPPAAVVGRGTGIDDAALAHKTEVITRALALQRPAAGDPLDVLAKLGGFEIAGLCGVTLGAAAARVPVILDGFIASTAALLAVRICPRLQGFLIASHRSAEPGHVAVLEALDLRPLLDLGLRLGEGTGAALAMPLVDAALRILHEMATFESAAVSDSGA